ncbi:MAG: ATP-binding protein [Candidatus Saccharibacteria bacterium]|nr:ATP-binding protein [Candidatus Saccharibacteria bacterium]
MNRREPTISKAGVASLRWAGIAITVMQIVYLSCTLISSKTTGVQTPYDPTSLLCLLTVMVILLTLNIVWSVVITNNARAIVMTLATYYLSVITFSLCVYNEYRDGVIALLWTIVLSTTGIILGRKSFTIGVVAMVASVVFSPIIAFYNLDHLVSLGLLVLLTIYTSYLFYRYREVGLLELRNYNQLKRRERLQTRRLQTLVNNIKDALIAIAPDGTVQIYNAAALSLLDTNANIIGVQVSKLFKLVDESGEKVSLSELINTVKIATERTDLRMEYIEGQYINLRLTIIPIKSQFSAHNSRDLDGVIIMAADITKEKSLDEERDEFIGVVSHELRTPVAIAEGALSNMQLLVERGGDPKMLASTLDAAHKQILYLGQMVNDLSTLSRAQRGVYMENERININEFFESLYNKYQGETEKHNLRLIANIDIDGHALVPSMVIEEIMQNLITNAIKYTEKGSVTIGARAVDGDKDHVEFYVRDTGIGIAKTEIKHVFERFWRSEDYRTRKTNGTGLGLHVVNQLAAKIGTSVNVSSRLNSGSTFSIILPLDKD